MTANKIENIINKFLLRLSYKNVYVYKSAKFNQIINYQKKKSKLWTRDIYYYNKNNLSKLPSDYKLFEDIEFNNSKTNDKIIAIGLNPAKADVNKVDRTNARLAYQIEKMGYSGYFLLNIYPVLSSTAKTLKKYMSTISQDAINSGFTVNVLKEVLLLNSTTKNLPVIFFWGPTPLSINEFSVEFSYLKQELQNYNNTIFYMTTYDNKFSHPGKRWFSFKKFSIDKLSKLKSIF